MYESLNDASSIEPGLSAGEIKIWYWKNDYMRSLLFGYNSYMRDVLTAKAKIESLSEFEIFEDGRAYRMFKERNPEMITDFITSDNISDTHVLLGSVREDDFDELFRGLQGESWSPNGEARSLIRSLGLGHTSMSVGDIIEKDGKLFMVDGVGFAEMNA